MYTQGERYSMVMDNIDPLIHWCLSSSGASSSIQIARMIRHRTSVDIHQHDILQSLDRLMRAGLTVQLSDGRYAQTIKLHSNISNNEGRVELFGAMLLGVMVGFAAGFMLRSCLLLL